MGNQARVSKDRTCKSCGHLRRATAADQQEHAATCSRMQAIGLEMAGGLDREGPPLIQTAVDPVVQQVLAKYAKSLKPGRL